MADSSKPEPSPETQAPVNPAAGAVSRESLGTWLCSAGLLVMFGGLLVVLFVITSKGLAGLWPKDIVLVSSPGGESVLGELHTWEGAKEDSGDVLGLMRVKVGNRDLYGADFRWMDYTAGTKLSKEPAALLMEREEYGVLIGYPVKVQNGDTVVSATDPGFDEALHTVWSQARRLYHLSRELNEELASMQRPLAKLEKDIQGARFRGDLDAANSLQAELEEKEKQFKEAAKPLYAEQETAIRQYRDLIFYARTASGQEMKAPLATVVRYFRPSNLGFFGKFQVYMSRGWEFLSANPRESNMEGGVLPALFGTALMVMIMTIACVPLGVVAAVYMHEYAKPGPVLSLVRMAVNNMAGVPSIVYGLFGLGFFIYGIGGSMDRLFFSESLPSPTFGTGGLLWASLTLALLTVPVVIVATLEGLAAVPQSYREASLALSATRWQTIRKVVLPSAMPGILTGMILAISRGAGEVAPLMITGVVKLAANLPLDGQAPFFHPQRRFMHLGFHIYDVAFQSPNVEAAKPMVYASILLLLVLVALLNLTAVRLRNRLREKLKGAVL